MTARQISRVGRDMKICQEKITTYEQLVSLKESIDYISDDSVAQSKLFPSTVELWKNIVQLRIKLFKLKEKEKRLKRQLVRERYESIDFSILDKYRRYKKVSNTSAVREEEEEKKHIEEQERVNVVIKNSLEAKKEPKGFMVRFSLDNAYHAIEKQELFLSRPKLKPQDPSLKEQMPVYVHYDRDQKAWKSVNVDGSQTIIDEKEEKTMMKVHDLGFVMADTFQASLAEKHHFGRRHSRGAPKKPLLQSDCESSLTSVHNLQSDNHFVQNTISSNTSPSSLGTSSLIGSSRRSSIVSHKERTLKRNKLWRGQTKEETKDADVLKESIQVLYSLTDKGLKSENSQVIVTNKKQDSLPPLNESPETKGNARTAEQESEQIEKLKMVASKISQMQAQLRDDENEDEEQALKNCRYMYRLKNCRCLAEPTRLFEEVAIKDQIVGTIDIHGHDEEGKLEHGMECVFCQTTRQRNVNQWIMSLDTGKTRGIYGDPRYDWFGTTATTATN